MIYTPTEQLLSLTSSQLNTLLLPVKSGLNQLLKTVADDKPTAAAAAFSDGTGASTQDPDMKLTQPVNLLPMHKGKSTVTGEYLL